MLFADKELQELALDKAKLTEEQIELQSLEELTSSLKTVNGGLNGLTFISVWANNKEHLVELDKQRLLEIKKLILRRVRVATQAQDIAHNENDRVGSGADLQFMQQAIEEARNCPPDGPGRPNPKVGAIVVKDDKVLAKAYRGQIERGEHAEFTALERFLQTTPIAGATVYTTLEPCTHRGKGKVPCVDRLIERKVKRVVIGMVDPDPKIRGLGQRKLIEHNIEVQLFPLRLVQELEELNREFVRFKKETILEVPSGAIIEIPAHRSTQKRFPQPESLQSDVRDICKSAFYSWNGIDAEAVRLVGADDEHFPIDRVEVDELKTPYIMPEALAVHRDEIIAAIESDAIAQGYPLFDGPLVRLVKYRLSPRDSSEDKYLSLQLAPMTWYDYILANQRFNDLGIAQCFPDQVDCREYVDFGRLVDERDVSASRLSNLLTTYITLITADGKLVYSQRSGNVASYRGLLMCATSENIHPIKDAVDGKLCSATIFRAAERGLNEELTPRLATNGFVKSLTLLGLEFHSQGFHPGLLFLGSLTCTGDELLSLCKSYPGKDFLEGSPRFVGVRDETAVKALLSQGNWFHAGKASIIRALEYVQARRGYV